MFSNTYPDRDVVAELVGKMLIEIKAVHFRSDEPYTFTSGLASPVYIDCRKIISYPRVRSAIMDFAGGDHSEGSRLRMLRQRRRRRNCRHPVFRLDRRAHGAADAIYPQETEGFWP